MVPWAESAEHGETRVQMQAHDPLDTLTPDTKEEPTTALSRILATAALESVSVRRYRTHSINGV